MFLPLFWVSGVSFIGGLTKLCDFETDLRVDITDFLKEIQPWFRKSMIFNVDDGKIKPRNYYLNAVCITAMLCASYLKYIG